MKRAYKYRIYPTEEQKKFFSICFAANCWFWNYSLKKIEKVFNENKGKEKGERQPIPSAKYTIARELPILKKENDTAWIKQAESTSLINTCEFLDTAIDRFFKGKDSGFPNYKDASKKKSYTFSVPKKSQDIINWKKGIIYFAKAGYVKCVFHRKFYGEIKSITVTKSGDDFYEASILVDDNYVKKPLLKHTLEGTVGIDMGSKEGENGGNAILSDGTRFSVIDYDKDLKRLKRLQKKLSKKEWFITDKKKYSKKLEKEVNVEIPSKNYIKLKNKIAKLHHKIARKRIYNTHQISSYVTKSNAYDTIAIESLNVKGMLKNRRIAKNISNANLGELCRQLEYKSDWYGKNFVKVDRFFASTKTCSVCGNKYEVGKRRKWKCPVCGTFHDRDINAAINIKKEGSRILSEGKQ